MTEPIVPNPPYDIVIIGGGPAGLTAGMYAARADLRTLAIAGDSTVSQVTVTDLIENYPGIPEGINGFDLAERLKTQAVQFGLETASGDVTAVTKKRWGAQDGWEITAGAMRYGALAVIIATGATWRRLGVPGRGAVHREGGLLLRHLRRPLLPQPRGRGCRRGRYGHPGGALPHPLREEGDGHPPAGPAPGDGDPPEAGPGEREDRLCLELRRRVDRRLDLVQRIRLKDVKTGAVRELPADGIFIFVGLTPNTAPFRELITLDQGGYVTVDANMQTSVPGIFACGDCTAKRLRQVVTACGDGATAAFSAQLYVEELKGEAY